MEPQLYLKADLRGAWRGAGISIFFKEDTAGMGTGYPDLMYASVGGGF